MKYIIFLLLLQANVTSAQKPILPVDTLTNKVTYVEVKQVDNKKSVLFKNAQTWAATTFGDYKSVVQFEDKESGKLILKGQSKTVMTPVFNRIKFKISIDVKENKYRCIIDDLEGTHTQFSSDWFPVTGTMAVAMAKENDSLANEATKEENPRIKRKIDEKIESNKRWVNGAIEVDLIMRGMLASLSAEMEKKDDF